MKAHGGDASQARPTDSQSGFTNQDHLDEKLIIG